MVYTKEKIWRVSGKILLFTALGGTLLFALLLALAFVFEKDIKNLAINELNKNLTSPVTVKSVNLSFFENFPKASLRFDGVKIRESYPGSEENVAEAEVLSLVFHPFDILRKNYRVSRIILQNGKIAIKIDKDGNANYLIWKADEKAEQVAAQDFKIALEKIELSNVGFSYEDLQKKMDFSTTVNQAAFNGTFTANEFVLGADAQMEKLSYKSGKIYYVKNKDINLKSAIEVNNTAGIFRIKEANLEVQKAHFDVAGQATNTDKGTKLDFAIKSKDASIKTLLALLPATYAKPFEDYSSDGKIYFDVKINGILNDKQTPLVVADFGIKNGKIKEKSRQLALENVSFKGHFTNGKKQKQETSSLRIENFKARLGDRDISADIMVGNFIDPYITVVLMTNLNLKDVSDFVKIKGVKSLSGDLFINAAFKGKTNELKKNQFGRTTLSGKMSLKDVGVYPDSSNVDYTALNGDFNFDGNNLYIESFSGNMGSSDFRMNGAFRNLASFLFLPDQKLDARAKFTSSFLNLNEFVVTQVSTNKADTVSRFSLPAFLLCDLQLDVQKLVYRRLVATDITGKASFRDNTLKLDGLKLNTMDGKVAMSGVFEGVNKEKFITRAKAGLTNINIEKLFYQLENFNQEFIKDEHLRGKLNANVDFYALWNSDLSVDMKSIKTKAELRIDNGELIRFDPLIKLGKYIKVKSMDHLKFNRLANNITIQDEVITIPEMEIKSSAVNLAVAGTHTFGNYMDYKMKVNVSQLLFGKRQDYENEFGAVQVNENGGINLFLLMKGPADNVDIKYDGNSLKDGLKKEIAKQKEELKNIFTDQNPSVSPSTNSPETIRKEKENKTIKSRNDYELKWEDEDENEQAPVKKEKSEARDENQPANSGKSSFDNLRNKLKSTFK